MRRAALNNRRKPTLKKLICGTRQTFSCELVSKDVWKKDVNTVTGIVARHYYLSRSCKSMRRWSVDSQPSNFVSRSRLNVSSSRFRQRTCCKQSKFASYVIFHMLPLPRPVTVERQNEKRTEMCFITLIDKKRAWWFNNIFTEQYKCSSVRTDGTNDLWPGEERNDAKRYGKSNNDSETTVRPSFPLPHITTANISMKIPK